MEANMTSLKRGHLKIEDIEGAPPFLRAAAPPARTEVPDADIAIVGAGMAGLYVAWRLLQQDPSRKIVILEKINRTGGRLDSDVVTTPDGYEVKEEEGGMRFTFDLMTNLMSLLLIFDLVPQIVPFPMNSGGNNRNFFRGCSFDNTKAQANDFQIWSELFHLKQQEQGLNPSGEAEKVFQKIVRSPENYCYSKGKVPPPEERTPEFWQDFRLNYKWAGVKLKDWSLWNLFSYLDYSNEFITLLYRVSGFNGTYLSNMSAGEAFQLLLDFPADPQFKTLKNGFSTLPNAMVETIGKEHIWLNTLVESVERDENNRLRLSYTRKPRAGGIISSSLTAEHVVLAVPRLALEKLFVASSLFRSLEEQKMKKLWNTLLTTTNQALVKINLYYHNAWWGHTGRPKVEFGPNFSDLPLGSVYPFYEIDDALFAALEYEKYYEDRHESVPPDMKLKVEKILDSKYDKPAALTIYCDYLNVEFWKALQTNGDLFQSDLQEEYKNEMFPASQRVVEEATKIFKLLFNTVDVPEPILTSSRIWSGTTEFDVPPQEQVGFGVHQWALNAQDDDTMKTLAKPIEDTNLYTCGEAYSDYQGWVEGALRSADLVLAKDPFNLSPISQVYENKHHVSSTVAIEEQYAEASTVRIRKYIDPEFPIA